MIVLWECFWIPLSFGSEKLRSWKLYISGYIDGLGDAVEQGLVKAVGVSNYSGTCLTFSCF